MVFYSYIVNQVLFLLQSPAALGRHERAWPEGFVAAPSRSVAAAPGRAQRGHQRGGAALGMEAAFGFIEGIAPRRDAEAAHRPLYERRPAYLAAPARAALGRRRRLAP